MGMAKKNLFLLWGCPSSSGAVLGAMLTLCLFITSQGEGLSGRAQLQGLLEVFGKQDAISVPWSQDHPIGRAEEGDSICQGLGPVDEHSHFTVGPHA